MARTCRACGRPLPRRQRRFGNTVGKILIVLVLAAFGVRYVLGF